MAKIAKQAPAAVEAPAPNFSLEVDVNADEEVVLTITGKPVQVIRVPFKIEFRKRAVAQPVAK